MKTAESVLFLAYYYPPQVTSGAERPRRFAAYLPEFGYNAIVISAEGRHSARITWNGKPDEKVMPDSPFVHVAARVADLAQRGLREHSHRLPWAPRAVAAALHVLAGTPVTAVFSTSPPLSTHLAAMRLKARRRIPWIADFRDPFADNPDRGRPLQRIYDPMLERSIMQRADAIIANTDAVADLWSRRYLEHKSKIQFIWNGFDPAEQFHPAPPAQRSHRVLAHVGDIYGMRNPSRVLDSIQRLLDLGKLDLDALRVSLIGPVDSASPMWNQPAFKYLTARGIVSCNNRVIPRAEAMQVIADADYLLLLDMNPAGGNLQVPAKLFDYIRAGRPILSASRSGSAVDRILGRSGVPYTQLEPDESESAIDGKIGAFLAQPPRAHEPSDWFWDQFDGRRQTGTLATILDRIRCSL